MNKSFNRRLMLRGLGGAAVAAPFLNSVAEREAKAQSMPATQPKRLIVFFTHYGCLTNRWFPAKSHGELTTADYMAMNTLKPMAPFAKKLLMVRGIRNMNEWSFAGSLGQKNDPHTQVTASYFTCQPVTPNAPNSGIDNIGKFDAKPTGRSLDHIAAEQVNPTGGAPLFMQIGGVTGSASNNMSVISWSDDKGTIFPGYGQPSQIYNQLTGLFGMGGTGTMTPDTYKVARGKSVIDIVREDLTNLQRINMSASDKLKLSKWVDLLHTTTTTVRAQCSAMTAMQLGVSGTATSSDFAVTAKTMMNLAVLSAICDSNRVIFMKMPPNYTFRNLNLTMESHSVSHRIGNAGQGGTCVANAIEMVHTIDKYYAECFAHLVGQLDGFSEGDRTVLDNSATVWFQEMSDGNSHNLNNMPILQAGSCGGYFKQGWAINVEKGVADMSPGNSDKDCANGQSTNLDAVGTPPTIASMPVNKYYCNLLNAIGVKANADGFPTKGGSAPVTKFGKYDDTNAFKDGGTKAVTIANPGEYMELRA